MAKFVDSVEKRVTVKRQPEKKVEDKQRQEVRKTIVPVAFEQNILDSTLPEHVAYTLQENGYTTVGDLVLQMKINADEVLRLQGIGPRAMNEINRLVEALTVSTPAEGTRAPAETEETPSGFEQVTAAPVDEIVDAAAAEPTIAEGITITPTSPVQEQTEASAPVGETPVSETTGEVTPAEDTIGEDVTFDELFTLRPEVAVDAVPAEEKRMKSIPRLARRKKKKGKKHVEIEFDPEAGRTFAKKKHKRGGEEWEF